MEFLGYIRIKPVRRQWEIPVQTRASTATILQEAVPPISKITYYLRYLAALPTLRLTLDNRSADSYNAAAL
jgi:hypothetical protein